MAAEDAILILSVEDDPEKSSLIEKLFRRALGARVDSALDCATARACLNSRTYDLITLDFQLPDGDGLELLEEILALDSPPPVVMVTGHGDEQTAVSAFKLGAAGYVVKDKDLSARLVEEAQLALARTAREKASAQREAEKALRESERKYRALVENLNEGIWAIDPEAKTTFVNERMAEMLGYTVDEMLGASLYDFMDERGREIAELNMDRRRQGFREQHDFEFRRKDGTNIYATLETSPMTDEEGNFAGAIAGVIDISDRVLAAQELARANVELEGYAHTVSHDLRNPLTNMMTAAALLEESLEDVEAGPETISEIKEMARVLSRGAENAYALVVELLALAEAGQASKDVEDVAVGQVMEKIIDENSAAISQRAARVELSADLGRLKANPTQVYQLFSNLFCNAIQHNTRDDLIIAVSYLGQDEDGAHRYLVKDNGRGIPEEDLVEVFSPFFKGVGGGSGIGLAIVERIVSGFDGKIRAYNNGGACFEFTIRASSPLPAMGN